MVVSRERVEGHASMTCPDDLRQHLIIDAPLTHTAIAYPLPVPPPFSSATLNSQKTPYSYSKLTPETGSRQ